MSSEAITLTIPASLAQELNTASQQFITDLLERGLRGLKIERALERYAQGGMSFGAAADEAGVSQSRLSRHAYARGLEPRYSAKTVAEELN
jgi:hypothetical protein